MAAPAPGAERSYTSAQLMFVFHSNYALAMHLLSKHEELSQTCVCHCPTPSLHASQLTRHQKGMPLGPERDAIAAETRRLRVQMLPVKIEDGRLRAEIRRRRADGDWGDWGEE